MRAVTITETGGPEVLAVTDRPDPAPAAGQVVVRLAAAGVNFIDTYQRSGLYGVELPYVPGLEGAGVVEAVGEGVDAVAVGDRVAWSGPAGSYAELVAVPASQCVTVPDGVELEVAASLMLQGMTAHYLACSTFPLEADHRCLVHAAAGGTGRLLVQIAKLRGAEVFATAGSAEKLELAASAGADHLIDYRERDFVAVVEEIAGERPLDVVYDGVGAATFDGGLAVLKPRGMMVTFGNASGPVDPVSPLALSQNGSIFLTRPTLFDYVRERSELEARAADLFDWVADGSLDVRVDTRFRFDDAAEAHRVIEGRGTTGKLLLVP